MPFSIDICLTNTGNTSLGPVFYAYSNIDSYTTPFDTNVLLSNIIQSSCPYVLNGVPDGTTTVLLKNISNGCCVYLNIDGTIDLCDLCDLGFDIYSSTTVSVVSVGDLTGSCEDNITDYVVNWYGPDSNTNVQFTSGVGSQFTYNWTHPLTGNSSVFVPPGVYVPQVESIILNGVELQEDLGAISNCFSPITVESFNCLNGTNPNPYYNHILQFSNSSQGSIPSGLTAEFILSSTTNYFAYAFRAETVSDTLKITYSGSNYDVPLVIEYLTMGQNLPGDFSNFNPNVFPKSGNTFVYLTKVLCLTGLTYVNGDKLIIEVEPNQIEPVTNWTLYFSCLDTFDCSKCIDTNTPYKIIQSSITGITGNCGNISISFKVSGCSANENNSDVINYMTGDGIGYPALGFNGIPNTPIGGYTLSTQPHYFNLISCNFVTQYLQNTACYSNNINNYSIYYRSWRPDNNTRQIEMKFENIDDFTAYTSNFYGAMVNSGSTNPLSLNYYTRLFLDIPIPAAGNGCVDGAEFNTFIIHAPTVQFVTGNTSEPPFNYLINITATTISDGININPCFPNCNNYVDGVVNSVNNTVQFPNYDLTGTSTVSLRKTFPVWLNQTIASATTSLTATIFASSMSIDEYSNITYIASGNPLVNISHLSAQTCNFSTTMSGVNSFGSNRLDQYPYYYRVESTNPSDIRDFSIYASPITNGVYNGFPFAAISSDLVYSIVNGTVTFANNAYLI